jgi:hypothetical protein
VRLSHNRVGKSRLAICVCFALVAPSLLAAQIVLPPVPHYDLPSPPLSLPLSLGQQRYIENKLFNKNHNNRDNKIQSFREWFREIYTDPVALFTFVLAISTIGLWIVTWWSGARQSRETRNLIAIARDEFTSSHPPRIVIRRVSLDQGDIVVGAPISRPWKVQYIVANVGRGNAEILEGNATVKRIEPPLPAIPPFDDAGDISGPIRLGAGQSGPLTVELDAQGPIVQAVRSGELANVAQGDIAGDIHFFGYMQYRDNIGIVRRTAFCRRYDIRTRRFSVVGDPDYEYDD